jgi:hypothetical protein
MRRFLLVALLLVSGCEGLMGPRRRAMYPEKVDAPCMPIPQQEYKARERLAFPDPSWSRGPRTWAEVPADQYGMLSH